ncbi:hemin ABC transporter substrate-binding protein [Demequina sp. NBRC 110056]|uniref:heme/hemin ABC transporter substrate-binding protein n=1 Tax=Demequina sp. NBRC 110056 TaxID=1570345 RepID=UPI000A027EAF|nr:ABC transporter substrate-binding protein [Demequina sp. NBRC 110056]
MRHLRYAVAAAAAVLLSGCGVSLTPDEPVSSADAVVAGDDLAAVVTEHEYVSPLDGATVLEDPAAFVGESTAVLADDTVRVLDEVDQPALPATVTSHHRDGDRDVTVTDASRVVAMDIAGSISATVWALGLGDALVGRDAASDFPGVEDLPVITGSSHTVNAEAILALEPTLVITDGSIGPTDSVDQLRDAGVPVVYVTNDSTFAGAEELARQVGAALGVPDAGDRLAERIGDEVDASVERIGALAPAEGEGLRMIFLYLRGTAGVYYMFGEESGADELVRALGGVDVAAEIGLDGMKPLTDEAMLAADPDLILVMSKGLESVGGVDGLLEAKPAIALTQAGQQRRFVDMADSQILAFGPRSAPILEALAAAIYAPADSSTP